MFPRNWFTNPILVFQLCRLWSKEKTNSDWFVFVRDWRRGPGGVDEHPVVEDPEALRPRTEGQPQSNVGLAIF